MIVVAVDEDQHSQFTLLEYASDIMQNMRDHLIDSQFPKINLNNVSKA